jgi:hypothetical protein
MTRTKQQQLPEARDMLSLPREEWPEETAVFENGASKKLLVWWPGQSVPARVYGEAHYGAGNFEILVCRDPVRSKEKYGDEALVYHWSGSSSGSSEHTRD